MLKWKLKENIITGVVPVAPLSHQQALGLPVCILCTLTLGHLMHTEPITTHHDYHTISSTFQHNRSYIHTINFWLIGTEPLGSISIPYEMKALR